MSEVGGEVWVSARCEVGEVGEVRGARCEVRGARCEVGEVRGAR